MFILDALNPRKNTTTKHSPNTAVFCQKPNNLNNIDFGDSNCPIEESVASLLPEIDTVQSKVSPDHNENNPSDITPNSHDDNEHCPKPVPTRLGHIEKPIPKPRPKPSQVDDWPSVPVDFQTTSSTKDGSDKTNINLSDLL